jgi:hypothetical protein
LRIPFEGRANRANRWWLSFIKAVGGQVGKGSLAAVLSIHLDWQFKLGLTHTHKHAHTHTHMHTHTQAWMPSRLESCARHWAVGTVWLAGGLAAGAGDSWQAVFRGFGLGSGV